MGAANPCARRRREPDHPITVDEDVTASVEWLEENSVDICSEGEEHIFEGKAMLLPSSRASTIPSAVDLLNRGDIVCPEGFCVVHSMTRGRYVLLHKSGVKEVAMEKLGMNFDELQMVARKRRAAAQGEYLIQLDRTNGTPLGISCEPVGVLLIIRDVAYSGLVGEWNEANPDEQVGIQDRIVEVNGIRGAADALIAELKKSQCHVVALQRAPPQQSAPQREETQLPRGAAAAAAADAAAAASESVSSKADENEAAPEVCLNLNEGAKPEGAFDFEIVVDKTGGASLGVAVTRASDGTLFIAGINGGLVGQWNEDNPDFMVQAGDRVVEINDIRGDADSLIAECKENKLLRLRLWREKAEPSEPI